jgi:hypothetical protein
LDSETGSALVYGRSGYEFALKNKQIAEDQLFIELRNPEGELDRIEEALRSANTTG